MNLQNYKAKDSGTYICNIKNDAGEANVELTLNIEGIVVSLSNVLLWISNITYCLMVFRFVVPKFFAIVPCSGDNGETED